MKKIIETDLVSIAHRILQMKDKSNINSLLSETEKLYQKLILLKFYEENKFRLEPNYTSESLIKAFDSSDSSDSNTSSEGKVESEEVFSMVKNGFQFTSDFMTHEIINDLVEDSKNDHAVRFDEEAKENVKEEVVVSTNETIEEVESQPEISSIPNETQAVIEEEPISFSNIEEEEEEEVIAFEPENIPVQALEIDPVFSLSHNEIFEESVPQQVVETSPVLENQHFMSQQNNETISFHQVPLNKTINDAFNNTIAVGLNDRIAFEKNLFNGSSEDLNRVISQLNTLSNFQEAKDFIDDLVKPDFSNWKGKEEYEERFMQLVEKRFL